MPPDELSYKAVVGFGTVEIEAGEDGEFVRHSCNRYLPEEKTEK